VPEGGLKGEGWRCLISPGSQSVHSPRKKRLGGGGRYRRSRVVRDGLFPLVGTGVSKATRGFQISLQNRGLNKDVKKEGAFSLKEGMAFC